MKFTTLLQTRIKTKEKYIVYKNSINLSCQNNMLNSTHKKKQRQKKIMTKMEKCCKSKTCKQQERQFKMDIQTKLYM